jgi:hypothetical protein
MSKLQPLSHAAGWSNQRLNLYHGTLDFHARSIINKVTLTHAKYRSDFGRGFYTTTVLRQAEAWARQLAIRRRSNPAVVHFQVDRDALAAIDCLFFVRAAVDADDYWQLIAYCRQGRQDHARTLARKSYDIVVGPVSVSWRRRLALHDSDQVSFHTRASLKLLNTSNPRVVP